MNIRLILTIALLAFMSGFPFLGWLYISLRKKYIAEIPSTKPLSRPRVTMGVVGSIIIFYIITVPFLTWSDLAIILHFIVTCIDLIVLLKIKNLQLAINKTSLTYIPFIFNRTRTIQASEISHAIVGTVRRLKGEGGRTLDLDRILVAIYSYGSVFCEIYENEEAYYPLLEWLKSNNIFIRNLK